MVETMRRQLSTAFLLVAAGCAVLPAPEPIPQTSETPAEATTRRAKASRPTYNLTGYPPAVRDGYIDGCESAKRSEYARKDARRMLGEPQYAMGWNDGFSICKLK
jgi:hypothetical protein